MISFDRVFSYQMCGRKTVQGSIRINHIGRFIECVTGWRACYPGSMVMVTVMWEGQNDDLEIRF